MPSWWRQLPTVKDFISVAGDPDLHGPILLPGFLSQAGDKITAEKGWAAAAKIVLATRDGLHS